MRYWILLIALLALLAYILVQADHATYITNVAFVLEDVV